jgi:predicted metal-dependent hydrolase
MLGLLRWHGAEEVEHRSLVYDVYQNVCGSYFIRAFSMLTTAPLFVGWWIAGARYLMPPTEPSTPNGDGESGGARRASTCCRVRGTSW